MADQYQGKPFPAADGFDRNSDPNALAPGDSDPLAELARLIDQTDPFGTIGRANLHAQPHKSPSMQHQQTQTVPPENDGLAAGPPPWLLRVNSQEVPQQEESPVYPSAIHPLRRYTAPRAAPEPNYHAALPFHDADNALDPSYHDDVLYGQLDADGQNDTRYAPINSDDTYAYQEEYYDGDGTEERAHKRRGGMVIVAVVLALAVVGTGAALAYRTYVGSVRSGEPPIIKADNSPTKIVPEPSDGNAKLPDRMSIGDGAEKIVPREEAPVDVNAKSGARVVFPQLNQDAMLPPASGPPGSFPSAVAGNGTLPNSEPRKIKTLTVRGEQPDGAAMPVASAPPSTAKPTQPARTTVTPLPVAPRSSANATTNAPLSLVPRANPVDAEPRARVANNTSPAQIAPDVGTSGGGYLVQVSSQKSEADAYASYRALQSKFPAVLGSHASVIKRADLGDKGVFYRAMVGPFGTPEEASQFCGNLKSAGGQCVVQRN